VDLFALAARFFGSGSAMISGNTLSRSMAILALCLCASLAIAADPAPTPPAPPLSEREYELLKLFADALDQIERNHAEPVDRRQLIEAAVRGMVGKLDPYSAFVAPDEMEKFRRGVESEFGGLGVQVAIEEGQFIVSYPLVGTPAFRAGLAPGDAILKINGQETKGRSLDEASALLKGPIGSPAKLVVRHKAGGKEDEVVLNREVIRLETAIGNHRGADDNWEFFIDAERKIGYIRLTSFSRHTAEELQAALSVLQKRGLKGLVLDLRFNPGGLVSAAVEVSDLFLEKGRIVSTEGRSAKPRVWEAKSPGSFAGFPLAVLVNRYSASASEIVAAALQDNARATLIGERTYGKGSVQSIIELEEGKSALKLTTSYYHRPSGQKIHRRPGEPEEGEWGVRPDAGFEVKLTDVESTALIRWRRERDEQSSRNPANADAPAAPDDKQLEKALDFIRGKLGEKPQPPGP